MSRSQYGRIERTEMLFQEIDQLARVAAVLGLELVMRVYPAGDPVRDEGQLRLTDRFRAYIGPGLSWAAEVPLPIPGDRRAWDGAITSSSDWIGVEIETRLRDIQAVQRRVALKCRDSAVERVILVIADTRANRGALAAGEASLRSQFPLGGREILASLRAGRLPEGSGIVLC